MSSTTKEVDFEAKLLKQLKVSRLLGKTDFTRSYFNDTRYDFGTTLYTIPAKHDGPWSATPWSQAPNPLSHCPTRAHRELGALHALVHFAPCPQGSHVGGHTSLWGWVGGTARVPQPAKLPGCKARNHCPCGCFVFVAFATVGGIDVGGTLLVKVPRLNYRKKDRQTARILCSKFAYLSSIHVQYRHFSYYTAYQENDLDGNVIPKHYN